LKGSEIAIGGGLSIEEGAANPALGLDVYQGLCRAMK
jgi:hypothetical protein